MSTPMIAITTSSSTSVTPRVTVRAGRGTVSNGSKRAFLEEAKEQRFRKGQ